MYVSFHILSVLRKLLQRYLQCRVFHLLVFFEQITPMYFSYCTYCCTDCMHNRPGVSAVRSLPVPQRLAHAAFAHCIVLSLCQLLKLNDDDDDDHNYVNNRRLSSDGNDD